MAALTVWKFDTVEGAGQALTKLESLSKQQLVTIEDAAIVYWETGKKKLAAMDKQLAELRSGDAKTSDAISDIAAQLGD